MILKQKKNLLKCILKVSIHGFVGFCFFHGVVVGSALCAASGVKLSKKEKKQLVVEGVAAYEKGDHSKAKKLLEQAKNVFAENYAVPYYLGSIYLKEGYRAAAISEWRRYLALEPDSENALKIRKYLTILKREQARENARLAVAQEATLMRGAMQKPIIAVAPFKNIDYDVFGPLGKGIAALLISDLSQVPNLEVVDRTELQMLLKELGWDTSGPIDAKRAAKVGTLLKANYVTTGSLKEVDTDNMQITSKVFDAVQNTSASAQDAEGTLTQFHFLVKEIACGIVSNMGENCDKLPAVFHKVHTRSLPALIAYSWGLDYLDQEKYHQSREKFQKALEKDPEFELAERALVSTPMPNMRPNSTSQMVSGLSSSGVSSEAAGNAMVGNKGISKKAWIIGGLAIVGGGAALAGGGGGGGDDNSIRNKKPLDVDGVWRGNWTGLGPDVTFKLTIERPDGSNSNSITVNNSQCITTGNATVTVNDPKISLEVQSASGNTFLWDGTCTEKDAENKCIQMKVNWQTGRVDASCVNGTGTFVSEKNSSTRISW